MKRSDQTSANAYAMDARVAEYEQDMELMHPNRAHMLRVAVAFPPHPRDAAIRVLDLGCGAGAAAKEALTRWPHAHVVCVDLSAPMLERARASLSPLCDACEFIHADIRSIGQALHGRDGFDLVISAFALHHFDAGVKQEILSACRSGLNPGGWLLNCDLVVDQDLEIEARIQRLRCERISASDQRGDARWMTPESARAALDRLEQEDGDQPLTVEEDLRILEASGFRPAALVWKEHREAVFAARRPEAG